MGKAEIVSPELEGIDAVLLINRTIRPTKLLRLLQDKEFHAKGREAAAKKLISFWVVGKLQMCQLEIVAGCAPEPLDRKAFKLLEICRNSR